jgi:cysteine desulfurase
MEKHGCKVLYAGIDGCGRVDARNLEKLIKDKNITKPFVSIMLANNEIGTIQDIKKISEIVHKYNGVIHCDAVQAFLHTEIDVKDLGIDMMSTSFHKFGGFKNCGFLYIKNGIDLSPLIHGGSQFNGRRSGTENIPGIYALGNQVERMSRKPYPDRKVVNYLFNKIYDSFINTFDFWYNGEISPMASSPNILSLTFNGINAEALITLLEINGVTVSAGSACCTGNKEPSRVLKAIGLTDEQAFHTIRISLGKDTTIEECDEFVKILGECLKSLKMVGGE